MRLSFRILFALGAACAAPVAMAQGPPDGRGGPPETPEVFADRMLHFDADRDGKLTKAEVTDDRLHRLFDRVDSDKDGVVTRKELTAFAARDAGNERGNPDDFGPGGPGGPGGGPGRGGPRAGMSFPGGPMMLPKPGEVLPSMLRQRLRVTEEQARKLDELQKDVDSRLSKILTEEQMKSLRQLPDEPGGRRGRRGPGGPPPDGPGGNDGRGGPPPDGPGGPPPE